MVGSSGVTNILCSLLHTATAWQSFFEGSGSKARDILMNSEKGPAVTYIKGKFWFRVSKPLHCRLVYWGTSETKLISVVFITA